MKEYLNYESPLSKRYASKEMQENFGDFKKFSNFRKLWIALAKSQKELGLPITQEQIEEMEAFQDNINFAKAKKKESEIRHDVMSHIYAYGLQCPKAKPIIHLGATSCFVGDNSDIMAMKDALLIIKQKLVNIIFSLSEFCEKYKDMPTLGFTHLQPAQLTTVGKRASLWLYDLMLDLEQLEFIMSTIRFRGVKGTTGTQASFMELFDNDEKKVEKLDCLVAEKMGFDKVYPVTGQTYSRKLDYNILSVLSGIAQSAYKFAGDLRILQGLKEIEEPFEKEQVGSSAMAYKRNPMRCERICSLARYVTVNSLNGAFNYSSQWLERTLDDSANRRISIPESFLAVDSVLNLYLNISQGLVVYPKVIEKRIAEELPFMATESIMMKAVTAGGDRQEIHERIRVHSIAAAKVVKEQGGANDLIERIANDPKFKMTKEELDKILIAKNFTGRASNQVEQLLKTEVMPILDKYKDLLGTKIKLTL